jgi:hypothetical protein
VLEVLRSVAGEMPSALAICALVAPEEVVAVGDDRSGEALALSGAHVQ